MRRKASCHCGQLEVICESEPARVIMCHCEPCQRRTGSSYILGAWFEQSAFSAKGEEKLYRRTGDQGIESIYHFCPTCGSNVYWEAPSAFAGMVAVAVGCFNDPDFPKPDFSLYGKRRLCWVQQPDDLPSHEAGMGSALEK